MLPQEVVYAASLCPVQDFTVPTCQELILFVMPCPDSTRGAGIRTWLWSGCGQMLFLAVCHGQDGSWSCALWR